MDNKIPFQVGLTGGIGSGKSVVAKLFGLFKVPVYESDTEAKKLYQDPKIKRQVIQLLGEKAYQTDGKANTLFIAKEIYSQPEIREKLNQILHPAVGLHYRNWLAHQTHPYVLKVAALIFEADIAKDLDFTLLVLSPAGLRKERVAERDPFRTAQQIDQIFESQWSDEKKKDLADGVIINSETESLITQVNDWNTKLLQRSSLRS